MLGDPRRCDLGDRVSPASGSAFSRDVETFVEIVEMGSATNVATVGRIVLVATCDKNFVPTGKVVCRSARLGLGTPVGNPLLDCRPLPPTGVVKTPADPVEMNTVVLGDFIKTIKVEKEVLGCGNAIGDVYLFTEVIERRSSAAPYRSRSRPASKGSCA